MQSLQLGGSFLPFGKIFFSYDATYGPILATRIPSPIVDRQGLLIGLFQIVASSGQELVKLDGLNVREVSCSQVVVRQGGHRFGPDSQASQSKAGPVVSESRELDLPKIGARMFSLLLDVVEKVSPKDSVSQTDL